MITEAYVSFKVAKLLKEKGFDIPCNSHFWENEIKAYVDVQPTNWNTPTLGWLSRPTHQMTLAWLREAHNIYLDIRTYTRNYPQIEYVVDIGDARERYDHWIDNDICCQTYEQATEAAILYTLQNLI